MAPFDADWFVRTRLKTRQLSLLVALDECRSIHRAAELMHVSQPAASKLLKEIENSLQVRLFDRLPREMVPTSYGESMIHHARAALRSIAAAGEDILAMRSGLMGRVDIGVIATPALGLVPRAIARVKRDAPKLRIGVELDSSDVLIERLRSGKLDFLVARILERGSKDDLCYEELADEPIRVIARTGHALLNLPKVTLEDLAQAAWVLSPARSLLRHRFDLMFHQAGLPPPSNVVESAAPFVIISLLSQSDFLHATPQDVARHHARFDHLAVLPVALPCRMDGFGIVTLRDRLLSPGARRLLDAIQDARREWGPVLSQS